MDTARMNSIKAYSGMFFMCTKNSSTGGTVLSWHLNGLVSMVLVMCRESWTFFAPCCHFLPLVLFLVFLDCTENIKCIFCDKFLKHPFQSCSFTHLYGDVLPLSLDQDSLIIQPHIHIFISLIDKEFVNLEHAANLTTFQPLPGLSTACLWWTVLSDVLNWHNFFWTWWAYFWKLVWYLLLWFLWPHSCYVKCQSLVLVF